MACLGLNVYFWGSREQDRLLAECLAPVLEELRRQGLLRRFWFDRFGARGPHLFLVLTLADGAAAAVEEQLSRTLDRYLGDHPSTVELTPEEVRARHDECRGKTLCEADRQPGLAANNTYLLFAHGARDYPFSLTAGLPGEEELWRLLDEMASGSLRELARAAGSGSTGSTGSTGAALRWLAALACALRCQEPRAESYWRYHATTLLPVLEERLASEEATVVGELPRWIGERNVEVFSRLWVEAQERKEDEARWRELLDIVLPGEATRRPWALLREIVHTKLKQLGVPVSRHVPAVLFAWHDARSATVARASAAAPEAWP